MTARTRYFVVASLLVLTVGLGTGLVAYFVGLPQGVLSSRGGPEELKYVPRTATIVVYANVQDVMHSEMRRRLRAALPDHENGQREFQNETGIDIERDIDHVVAFVAPVGAAGLVAPEGPDSPDAGRERGSGLVLARGRFDEAKIEALLRERGAQVETYKGRQLYVATGTGPGGREFGLTFLEPGLTALGSTDLLRTAVDLASSGDNVTSNEDLDGPGADDRRRAQRVGGRALRRPARRGEASGCRREPSAADFLGVGRRAHRRWRHRCAAGRSPR